MIDPEIDTINRSHIKAFWELLFNIYRDCKQCMLPLNMGVRSMLNQRQFLKRTLRLDNLRYIEHN